MKFVLATLALCLFTFSAMAQECQKYPLSYACEGSAPHCKLVPLARACEGSPQHCDAFPFASACEGTRQHCEKNPLASACEGSPQHCQRFPYAVACEGVHEEQREDGRIGRNDPPRGSSDWCSSHPRHRDCRAYRDIKTM